MKKSLLFCFSLNAVLACATGCPQPDSTADAGLSDAGLSDAGLNDAIADAGEKDAPYDAGVLTGPVILGGERPVEVYVPTDYKSTEPMPLVLFLHGYGFSGAAYEDNIRLTAYAEERGFFYIVPEGNLDANNAPYWNAFDACCDFLNTGVDDSGYLRGLIEEAMGILNVDKTRIHIIGHSNGGFMSYAWPVITPTLSHPSRAFRGP